MAGDGRKRGESGEKNERSLISTGHSAWMTGERQKELFLVLVLPFSFLMLAYLLGRHSRCKYLPACQERSADAGTSTNGSTTTAYLHGIGGSRSF
jgi:hypothetical protein